MMASQQAKCADPMYNFDTHFPERLSSLHIHGETFNTNNSFRKKKSRAQRSGARYKTQPVTFDEILEVDEEPLASSSSSSAVKDYDKRASSSEHIIGQLQAFSRSMDGLLPKSAMFPEHIALQRHVSLSRSGSRKYKKHPDCIPERVESEPQSPKMTEDKENVGKQPQSPQQDTAEQRLSGDAPVPKNETIEAGSPTTASSKSASLAPPSENVSSKETSPSPMRSPNIGPRRQKITAKAKKRQKAQGDGDGNLGT